MVNPVGPPGIGANLHGQGTMTKVGLESGMDPRSRGRKDELLLLGAEPELEAADRDDGQLGGGLDLEKPARPSKASLSILRPAVDDPQPEQSAGDRSLEFTTL